MEKISGNLNLDNLRLKHAAKPYLDCRHREKACYTKSNFLRSCGKITKGERGKLRILQRNKEGRRQTRDIDLGIKKKETEKVKERNHNGTREARGSTHSFARKRSSAHANALSWQGTRGAQRLPR